MASARTEKASPAIGGGKIGGEMIRLFSKPWE